MPILPPGTLLQLMYFKDRLRAVKAGRFVEIGRGAGHASSLLLSLGWLGTAYELERSTVAALERRFANEIAKGRYRVVDGDWLETNCTEQSIWSCRAWSWSIWTRTGSAHSSTEPTGA
jgi:16S rRNA A1518/A1519 N6-dimethyltransferase RsmA/KsgA/DIM1 with predicted DNA glycosylase/AP lyase activity